MRNPPPLFRNSAALSFLALCYFSAFQTGEEEVWVLMCCVLPFQFCIELFKFGSNTRKSPSHSCTCPIPGPNRWPVPSLSGDQCCHYPVYPSEAFLMRIRANTNCFLFFFQVTKANLSYRLLCIVLYPHKYLWELSHHMFVSLFTYFSFNWKSRAAKRKIFPSAGSLPKYLQ